MATLTFDIFKRTDRQLVQAFKHIAQQCGGNLNVPLKGFLAADSKLPIQTGLGSVDDDESFAPILGADGAIVQRLAIHLHGSENLRVVVTRGSPTDKAEISGDDNCPPSKFAAFLVECQRELPAYARTPTIDKLLGDELAEFYRRREEALLRLEATNQTLVEKTAQYRRQLEEEDSVRKQKLEAEYKGRDEILATEHRDKEEKLRRRSEELDQRTKELDDRSSRHARRKLRQDLSRKIAARHEKLTLTKGTVQKRLPIHILYVTLVLGIGIYAFTSLFTLPKEGPALWIGAAKASVGILTFAASLVFYIRWNDQWFRQHAEAEFSLQRFDLDVDRAEWVIETALDWKEIVHSDIPSELLGRISANLFATTNEEKLVRHPSEDLASALLGASSALSLKIPGLGEASLNRRGIKEFQKAAEDAKKSDETK